MDTRAIHQIGIKTLPDTVLENVFNRLPIEALKSASGVNKHWNAAAHAQTKYADKVKLERLRSFIVENVVPLSRTNDRGCSPAGRTQIGSITQVTKEFQKQFVSTAHAWVGLSETEWNAFKRSTGTPDYRNWRTKLHEAVDTFVLGDFAALGWMASNQGRTGYQYLNEAKEMGFNVIASELYGIEQTTS